MNEKKDADKPRIEFVSYDGAYPNLCSGTFIVKIDGKETSFGRRFLREHEKKSGIALADYPRFWISGGGVSFDDEWNEIVYHDEWQLNFEEKDYPKHIVELMPELIKAFNENVPYGCCGGCV